MNAEVLAVMFDRTSKIVSEYDQEIPQSRTADNSMAPRGRLILSIAVFSVI